MNCRYTADQSALIMAGMLRRAQPFIYLRFGDGILECLAGKEGGTRDMEQYSPQLAEDVLSAWAEIKDADNVYIGDWQSATFNKGSEYSRYEQQYAKFIGWPQWHHNWLHFESLLLMRRSTVLVQFYEAVKSDTRKKVFMGPYGNRRAADMLGADYIETPMHNLLDSTGELLRDLSLLSPDILLYGAGMAGNIPAMRWWADNQDRTVINLGSAMDPLFRGKSRSQQMDAFTSRRVFAKLLGA